MKLVNRHDAGLELRDALSVDVRADDIVPRLGQTRAGYQANIATTNYRKIQGVSPKNSPGTGAEGLGESRPRNTIVTDLDAPGKRGLTVREGARRK
jgi:hypothetical protein